MEWQFVQCRPRFVDFCSNHAMIRLSAVLWRIRPRASLRRREWRPRGVPPAAEADGRPAGSPHRAAGIGRRRGKVTTSSLPMGPPVNQLSGFLVLSVRRPQYLIRPDSPLSPSICMCVQVCVQVGGEYFATVKMGCIGLARFSRNLGQKVRNIGYQS